MDGIRPRLGWAFSALVLRYGGVMYSGLLSEIDQTFLTHARDQIEDGVVYSIAGGEGNWITKAMLAGAREGLLTDGSPAMLAKAIRRMEREGVSGVDVICEDMYAGGLRARAATREAPNVIEFKRCLYGSEEQVRSVLSDAFDVLVPGGVILVAQATNNDHDYDRNERGGFAWTHWVKRQSIVLGNVLGTHPHVRYSHDSLRGILRESTGGHIENLPVSRPAYHLFAVHK